jgi:ABC-type glycerol-3-phosphate transport system permease component
MNSKRIMKYLLISFLTIGSIIALFPILLMVMDSFKTASDLSNNSYGLPARWVLKNYKGLLNYNGGLIVRTFLNGLFVSTSNTILTLFISALAAYSFSKYKFAGQNIIFVFLLATMMIPAELTLPPLFILFSKIHWLNTYWVQIIPGIANVFCMFMLKEYIDSLPNSLIEAARIDGAGHFRVFFNIMMPLASPAIGTLAILTFLSKWNNYLWPIMLLNDPKIMPIMAVLPTLNDQNSVWSIPWELLMAGCTIVTLPIIIVFFIFQNKFMSSITIGAVKE